MKQNIIIIQETEQRVLKHYGKRYAGHFKSQPQIIPYEVTQLAFDIDNETVIITLDNKKNRDSLLHMLNYYKYLSAGGFKAPEFNATAQGENDIVCLGPIDGLMEVLELNEYISSATIEASPVKPRVSVVPE